MIVLICVLALLILTSVIVSWCICRYCTKQKSEPLYSDGGAASVGSQSADNISFHKPTVANSSTFSSIPPPSAASAMLYGNGNGNGNGNGDGGHSGTTDTFSY
jgi:hypothetical protein